MLEALAAASAELEHVSQRLNDQLGRAGSRIRNTLVEEIRLSRQRVEQFLTAYLSSSTRDKDKLLTELSRFRHEEVRALTTIGQECRAKLNDQSRRFVEDNAGRIRTELNVVRSTVNALKSDAEIEADRAKVARLSAECSQRIHDLFATYIKRLPEIPREKMETATQVTSKVTSDTERNLSKLLDQLRTDLDAVSKVSTRELARHTAVQQEKVSEFQGKLDDLEKNLSERFFQLWNREEIDEYFTELTDSFEQSMNTTTELQSGTFQEKLRNVTHQSKIDIQGTSRNCREEMTALQVEFTEQLAEQQRTTWDQCDALLQKLEKAIEHHISGADGAPSERIRSALRRVTQEFRGRTAQKSFQMEMYFDKTAEGVLKSIEMMRDESCEALEGEFTVARREFGLLFEDVERQLAELQKQTNRVEKAGLGIASLIGAIKKARISFQQETKE